MGPTIKAEPSFEQSDTENVKPSREQLNNSMDAPGSANDLATKNKEKNKGKELKKRIKKRTREKGLLYCIKLKKKKGLKGSRCTKQGLNDDATPAASRMLRET